MLTKTLKLMLNLASKVNKRIKGKIAYKAV